MNKAVKTNILNRIKGKGIDRSVISCFFLAAYFILHEFNANYGLVSLSTASGLLMKYMLIVIIVLFLALLIFIDY